MRIITLNVNGLRAAERKGFARWLARIEPWDVVCLQEIKCDAGDVPRPLAAPRKSHASFHPATKKGYSGVALYAK
ncbi:MAG TPA: endonuclease/exonuclease/phosphatase family protein, partial [Casimicrobiaceae bacterium]|nr:endonuclease/exonuclease/phosphatase family protein [Casimicrobiaceae bacterium]